jgi:hypothetical protein
MAAIRVDGSTVRQVLLDTGWVEVRNFEVTAATQVVDGVPLGASATFETRQGRRTVPMSAVFDVFTVDSEAEAEAARLAQAEQSERDARLFEWQHYTDRETYDQLAEAQDGRCAGCGTDLRYARFVHLFRTEDGPVLLHRDLFAGCSPLAPRLGEPV